MKTNGATWNAYLNSWPKGQWFDDSDETFDGKEPGDCDPEDAAIVEFTTGLIFRNEKDRKGMDLVEHFMKWQKGLTTVSIVCDVPKEKLIEVQAYLKARGVSIVAGAA